MCPGGVFHMMQVLRYWLLIRFRKKSQYCSASGKKPAKTQPHGVSLYPSPSLAENHFKAARVWILIEATDKQKNPLAAYVRSLINFTYVTFLPQQICLCYALKISSGENKARDDVWCLGKQQSVQHCLGIKKSGTMSCIERWLCVQNDSALTTPQPLSDPSRQKHIHLPAREERQENQWLHTQLYHNLLGERSPLFPLEETERHLISSQCMQQLTEIYAQRINKQLHYGQQ